MKLRAIVYSLVTLTGLCAAQNSYNGSPPTVVGAVTTGHCVSFASASTIQDAGSVCAVGGAGTVTSVVDNSGLLNVATATTVPTFTFNTQTTQTFLTTGAGTTPGWSVLTIAAFPSALVHGNSTKVQLSDGTGTSGNVPKYDAAGNVVDGGLAVGSIVSGSRLINTTAPLGGGGNLTADRTLTCTTCATTTNGGALTGTPPVTVSVAGAIGITTQNFLNSALFTDVTASAATRGDGLFAIGATPMWTRVAHSAATGGYWKWNGTDVVASTGAASGTGTCTSQVPTTLNADAAPTCTTLTPLFLPSTTVNSVVNDTNVTGSITAQALTLGWTGTLAKSRIIATAVYNDQGNTYTTGTQDFTGTTLFKVRVSAGLTTATNGEFGYDSTGQRLHVWDGFDSTIPATNSKLDLTGQLAVINATSWFTPAVTGMYQFKAYARVTTIATTSSLGAGGGVSGLVLTGVAEDGTAITHTCQGGTNAGSGVTPATGNTTNTTQASISYTCSVYLKSGTAVTYAFGYTSAPAATMQFSLHATAELQ